MKSGILLSESVLRSKGFLSVVLSVVLAAPGTPFAAALSTPKQAPASGTFVQNAGRIFHLDSADLWTGLSNVFEGGGTFSVTLTRAEFAADDAAGTVPGTEFVFGREASVEDFELLGADPSDVQSATGRDLAEVREWHEVINWTVTSGVDEITTSYRVGTDTLLVSFPRAFFEAPPQGFPEPFVPPVEVEVNGFRTELDAEAVAEMIASMAAKGVVYQTSHSADFRELLERFRNPHRFLNGFLGFYLIAQPVGTPDSPSSIHSRTGACLGCAGSILLAFAAGVAIGVSCPGAVATGGALLPACIGSLAGGVGAVLASVPACEACAEPDEPEEPPDPNDPPPGGGNCPSGCSCCGQPRCDCGT